MTLDVLLKTAWGFGVKSYVRGTQLLPNQKMSYSYLLFWLSRHCGWYVWKGSSAYLDRRGRWCMYWPSLLLSTGKVQCDHLVGMRNLLEEPLFALHRWLRCLRPDDPNRTVLLMRKSCCSLPASWPATPTQCSSMSATLSCPFYACMPSLPPASTGICSCCHSAGASL